jgi:hypothetical protein
MSDLDSFDQGYLFGLLAIDTYIRKHVTPNITAETIRKEIIALMNDQTFKTFTDEVEIARSNRCD